MVVNNLRSTVIEVIVYFNSFYTINYAKPLIYIKKMHGHLIYVVKFYLAHYLNVYVYNI